MAGKNQRENMDWVMTELDLHHVKERDVEVSTICTTNMLDLHAGIIIHHMVKLKLKLKLL